MKLDTKILKTITILYVEDDQTVREQTGVVLTKIFKELFIAKDGLDGFKIFQEHKDDIDIVVCDINMPIMNGLEMIEKINEIKTQIPTIITTAHTDSKYIMSAMEKNVDKYMPKPLQIKQLTTSIVQIVQKYRRLNNIETLARTLMEKTSKDESLHSSLNAKLERLQVENSYLNAIIDNMVIKLKCDKSGQIMETSDKFLRFFQLSKEEIIGKSISIIRSDECTQESFQKLMLKAIHNKKSVTATYSFEYNNIKATGDVTLTPIYAKDMFVSEYIIYVDIL